MPNPNYTNGLSESWKHLIGLPASNNTSLTKEQFNLWLSNPDRKFICDACGQEPVINLENDFMHCPGCRDYKYIVPLIPDWSWEND